MSCLESVHVHHGESVSCCYWVLCSVCGCQVLGLVYSSPAFLIHFPSGKQKLRSNRYYIPSGSKWVSLLLMYLSVSPLNLSRGQYIWVFWVHIFSGLVYHVDGLNCYQLYNDLNEQHHSFWFKVCFHYKVQLSLLPFSFHIHGISFLETICVP